MIEVTWVNDLDETDAVGWNDLLRDSEINEVFLTYEWIKCWWKCFGPGKELVVLVAREFDHILGIAPLMLSSRGRGGFQHGVIEFLGTGESDYCDFIVAASDKKRVLREFSRFLDKQRDRWDVISLRNIPERSRTLSYIQEFLQDSPLNVRQFVSFNCPTILMQEDPAFALQCTKKKSLKRHFNYFDRSGHLAFRTIDSRDEILEVIEEFFQQHIERRAIAGGLSKFFDDKAKQFYRCLVNELLEPGWLKFGMVTFNDIAIAYHFGFEYCGKFIWYKPAFNIEYIQKSPGEVLIKFLLEDAIRKELTEFDFTIGDEPFKRRFANKIRKNMQVEIVSNRRIWIVESAIRGVKVIVKEKLPRVFSFLRVNFNPSKGVEFRHKIQNDIHRYGLLGTGREIVKAVIKYCFVDVKVICVYRCRDIQGAKNGVVSNFLVRQGRITDSRSFVTGQPPVRQKDLLSKWLGKSGEGDKLFVGEIGGQLVYFAWVSFKQTVRIPGIDRYLDLGDEETAFINDWDTKQENRRESVSATALHSLTESLLETSACRVIICCNGRDSDERSEIEQTGFEHFVTYTKVRIIGIPFVVKQYAAGKEP